MEVLLYIGPGMGIGTTILVFLVLGLVVFSLGWIGWIYLKNFFRRLFRKRDNAS